MAVLNSQRAESGSNQSWYLNTDGECSRDGNVHSRAPFIPCVVLLAQAYDAALVRMRGTAAATNFALAGYRVELAEFLNVQQVTLDAESCPWVACAAEPCWDMAPWTSSHGHKPPQPCGCVAILLYA